MSRAISALGSGKSIGMLPERLKHLLPSTSTMSLGVTNLIVSFFASSRTSCLYVFYLTTFRPSESLWSLIGRRAVSTFISSEILLLIFLALLV